MVHIIEKTRIVPGSAPAGTEAHEVVRVLGVRRVPGPADGVAPDALLRGPELVRAAVPVAVVRGAGRALRARGAEPGKAQRASHKDFIECTRHFLTLDRVYRKSMGGGGHFCGLGK